MSLNDYLLLALVQYGLPVLFGAILVSALGLPLPATLLLLTAGSFVAQGELALWPVLGLAIGGAVSGDLLGYSIGRWGSDALIARFSRWGGGPERIQQAEQVARRWGGIGIFLSRWLLTPIGPVVNLTSGITHYPMVAFLAFGVVGEALWVGIYVTMGHLFSDQVQTISEVLGNFSGVILGVVAMAILGWLLWRQSAAERRTAGPSPAPPQAAPE